MQQRKIVEDYLNNVIPDKISDSTKAELRAEIESHIYDKAEFYIEIGYDEETAFKKAIVEMGEAEPVREEFSQIYKAKPHIFFVISAFFATASICLYYLLLILIISELEFEDLFFLLLSAEITLLLALIFAVSTLISFLRVTDEKKLRKNVTKLVACVLLCSALFGTYGYIGFYNLYEPAMYAENPGEYLQPYFPFHDTTDGEDEFADIEVSHFPGTDLVEISAMGSYSSEYPADYKLRYLESYSPFLNKKFSFETRYAEKIFHNFKDFPIDEGEKAEFEGVTYTPFIDEDFYGIVISGTFHTCFISITDISKYDMTFDDFIKDAIEQYKAVRKATKEKFFLDIPFEEQLEYVLSNF